MDFEDALQRMAPLQRVGPLKLRYEPSLLVVEPAELKRPFSIDVALRLLALVLGIAAVTQLLVEPAHGTPWGALVTAVLAVGAWFASWLFERRQRQRRFILNFGTESLRIDDLPTPLRRPRTRTMKFDDVASVDVVQTEAGFQLQVTLTPSAGEPVREVLADNVRPEEVEELRRLWRVLHDAFGLKRAAPELR